MEKIVEYKLTEDEYNKMINELGLLEDAVHKERDRLRNIRYKSDSEVIASNMSQYYLSSILELRRLLKA